MKVCVGGCLLQADCLCACHCLALRCRHPSHSLRIDAHASFFFKKHTDSSGLRASFQRGCDVEPSHEHESTQALQDEMNQRSYADLMEGF